MKFKILAVLMICLLALSVLPSQILAKDGADDSIESSGSSNQESESRGGEDENEQRGQEPEAERGGATEVKGQEAEQRGQEAEIRGGNSSSQFETEFENEIEIEGENGMKINGQDFEISGIVESISDNVVIISGEAITLDPEKVDNFQQAILLEVGKSAKIQGIIDADGNALAREIENPEENADINALEENDIADDDQKADKDNNSLSAVGNFFKNLMSSLMNIFK